MTSNRYEPTLFTTSSEHNEWTQIECGAYFTAAVTKEGALLTWGANRYYQLGHGKQCVSREIPTRVSQLDGFVITHVSCGKRHMAALTDKGEVLTW